MAKYKIYSENIDNEKRTVLLQNNSLEELVVNLLFRINNDMIDTENCFLELKKNNDGTTKTFR